MQSSYALIPRACNIQNASRGPTILLPHVFKFRRTTAGLLFVSLFFFFFQSSLNSSTFAASTSHGSTHGLSRIRVLDPLRTALHGSDRVPAAMLEVKVGDNHVHRFEVMPWDGLHPKADPGLHSEFVALTDHHDASFLFRRSTEYACPKCDRLLNA
ncbi:hypothetical protein BCR44DRAFT_1427907 [Catenaria anguillulae PL171]|uniref:Uncharacterized protein n=1 Tax=Catenaria anguillulae PL171 TaxID=765915 RepID=A0A1Y2HW56_9FUNG|nr:hypothetical protein BCR44DRAFT_1427907 [Catenaria anguillulae PL171]